MTFPSKIFISARVGSPKSPPKKIKEDEVFLKNNCPLSPKNIKIARTQNRCWWMEPYQNTNFAHSGQFETVSPVTSIYIFPIKKYRFWRISRKKPGNTIHSQDRNKCTYFREIRCSREKKICASLSKYMHINEKFALFQIESSFQFWNAITDPKNAYFGAFTK